MPAGRPRELPVDVREEVLRLYRRHGSYEAVARVLNARRTPTARGDSWRRSSVQHIVSRGL